MCRRSSACSTRFKDGTVDCRHTAGYYFIGKDPAFAFDAAIPFGLNSRQQSAWLWEGGGMDLLREFFLATTTSTTFPAATPARKWVAGIARSSGTLAGYVQGLKMRIGGLGGPVLAKLGVIPQQIAGGDIYPAFGKKAPYAMLLNGWVPMTTRSSGFNKVAKYYYYPGFWEGSTQISLYVNQKKFRELPRAYQQILEDACAYAHLEMQARYDVRNVNALRRLVAAGAALRPFSREIMMAASKAAEGLYSEYSARNAKWKKIYDPWKKFRDEELLWFRVAEKSFDDFMHSLPPERG